MTGTPLTTSRRPFQAMTTEKWTNLALAGLALFYSLQIALDVIWKNLCGHLGVDYCAFWSAGRLAAADGFAQMYNLDRLAALERSLFPAFGDPATFAVSPIAYLPVFMLPFRLLSMIPVATSFWLWTLINLATLAIYLRFFILEVTGQPLPPRLLALMLLSVPVFWNVLDGQVSVWLMISLGEFLRAMLTDRPFRAGLWLGGLLLKPQLLILIVLALVLQRWMKVVAGLVTSSVALLVASVVLVGPAGFLRMLEVWLGFARGIPTNYVELMMNWRMLGLHVSSVLGPLSGAVITAIGIIVTSAAALLMWRKPIGVRAPSLPALTLGTMAATGLVAWHSHIPSAMILIPVLLLLNVRGNLSERVLLWWVFLPAAAYIVALALAALTHLGGHADSSIITTSGWLNFIRGGSVFALNIYLLWWAARRSAHALAFGSTPS